ncbi:methyl-accepting chemotaxis sensory transducer, class 40+24H [Geotalea daltonii FRC-32]|uniref:Methyl-accepting chemotaxis sensory transducer, class 40+24H n=1 Tax=Geotalea daltonii (strain DSM 22248 / JCM 15807 / FRC-32) TaxID=316067 RepID=B9M6R1_GEODF|nr:methyl-accepting chemotaxis protein [Geotalea daltonii]ACM20121.1 methyl-accepting chemotaxis sensory transducer, class 40+24H [Geotalea daltonii FRC-32]
MKKGFTIKQRVLATLAGIFFAGSLVMGLWSYFNQLRQIEQSHSQLAHDESRLFKSMIAIDGEGLARAHSGLDRLDDIIAPFAAKNRELLMLNAAAILAELKQNNNITHLYFIEPDGTVFLRAHKPEQSGDRLQRATYLQAAATGNIASGLEMGKNFFSLRSVRPISHAGNPVGYLEVAQEIDHVFDQMKGITGNDVSLFLVEDFIKLRKAEINKKKAGNFTILESTAPEKTLQLAAKLGRKLNQGLKEDLVQTITIGNSRYVVGISPVLDASGTAAGILLSTKDVSQLYTSIWKGILINILLFAGIMAGALLPLYLSLKKSMKLFTSLRNHIQHVTTNWDLAEKLEVGTSDEIGQLAVDINNMTENLSMVVNRVRQSSNELAQISSTLQEVSTQVVVSARQQVDNVQQTSATVMEISSSVKKVTGSVDGLSSSASQTSSSITEMVAGIEETAINMDALADMVEQVSASVTQMTAAIHQVGANVTTLSDSASNTSASATQMDATIKQVEKTTRESVLIAEQVLNDANHGKQSVDAIIEGIKAINSSTMVTADAINNLSANVDNIGTILAVIDEVTGQTNLLALNASIIAAQAGEHGKSFAVVADEIKELADRTKNSTREIADVIRGIQGETERAVKAIKDATSQVTQGEKLSRSSEEALIKIVEGVKQNSQRVDLIARSMDEQATTSQYVSTAMHQMSEMVSQIATANREQEKGGEIVQKAASSMGDLARIVKNATQEQCLVGGQITKATEHVSDMISQIMVETQEQGKGSERIINAVENIRIATDEELSSVQTLNDSLDKLGRQIGRLQAAVEQFQEE